MSIKVNFRGLRNLQSLFPALVVYHLLGPPLSPVTCSSHLNSASPSIFAFSSRSYISTRVTCHRSAGCGRQEPCLHRRRYVRTWPAFIYDDCHTHVHGPLAFEYQLTNVYFTLPNPVVRTCRNLTVLKSYQTRPVGRRIYSRNSIY